MSDWEDELEKEEKNETEEKRVTGYEDETEEIIKPKKEPTKPQKPKEPIVDYEKLYQKKHKEQIEDDKEIEKAVEGIKDKDLKLKKKLELQNIKRAEKFLGKAKEEENLPLNVEKDFIDLAIKNTNKIKDSNKPQVFTFSYLKNTLELLCPTLESYQISDLIKVANVIYNKKLKEEGFGKKKNKKPSVSSNKRIDRDAKQGLYDEYGERVDYEEEEEYNEDEDFM
jgi:hypothetical protein